MTPHDIGNLFLRDYLIAMYVATLGAVQIGASYGGLRGMFFLPTARATRILGAALVVLALLYFFTVPLWQDGPWGAATATGGVVGRDGLTVAWNTASWSDLGGAHNLNDVDGGLSGGSQGIWFPLAAGLALMSTFLISSLINRRLRRTGGQGIAQASGPGSGLDGVELLKEAPWTAAVGPSLRAWRAEWRRIVREEFDGTAGWGGMRWVVNRWRSR